MNALLAFLPPPVQMVLTSKWLWRLIGVFIIVFTAWWFYDTYRDAQDEVLRLQQVNQELSLNISHLEQSIVLNEATNAAQSATVARLTKEANSSRAALDRLREQFAKTDLGKAALKSPSEIEAMIDKASVERTRCMEIAAGDTVKEEDKVNNVCPQLVK